MVDKIKKIKTEVKGLYIRNNGYYLERMINKERLRHRVGRVGFFSADAKEDLRKAETIARELIVKVTDHGLASIKGLGATPILTQYTKGKTLAEVLEDHIAHASKYGTPKTQGKPISASSLKRYKYLSKHAWKPLMDLPIASISKELLKKWYMDLVDEGLKEDWKVRHNEALRNLSRIFTWAVNKEWLDNNVANNLFLSENKQPNRVGKADEDKRFDLKTNEIGRFIYSLLHASPETNKQNSETSRDLILTYILTGGRQSEIKKMQWSWFADKTSEDAFNSFISPPEYTKTSKAYFYPCCVLLKDLFSKRYKNREALAEASKGDSALKYVFPDRLGRKHLEDARGRIDLVSADAGINRRIGYHHFRRTFLDILQQCTDDNDLRIRAMHHTNKNLTHGTYGSKDINDDRLRGLFQDVEDYLSNTLPLTGFSVSGEKVTLDGTEKIGRDNRTKVDNRINDKEALRDIVFGRRTSKIIALGLPKIQNMNLEFIKNKFPDAPDDYFTNRTTVLEDAKVGMKIFYQARGLLNNVKEMMGYDKADKVPMKKVREFADKTKLKELKDLRRKYNNYKSDAIKVFKKSLTRNQISTYINECRLKAVNKLLNKKFKTLELVTDSDLKDLADIESDIDKIKFMLRFFEKEFKNVGTKKLLNRFESLRNKMNYFIEEDEMQRRSKSAIEEFIEICSHATPILDQFYINLKKQYKDTKDSRKVIWLSNVRTSVDESNDLPTLEVK